MGMDCKETSGHSDAPPPLGNFSGVVNGQPTLGESTLHQYSNDLRRTLRSGASLVSPGIGSGLWDGLKQGLWKVSQYETRQADCSLSLRAIPASDAEPIPDDQMNRLLRVLLGECQKVIAMEDGVSYSTISAKLSRCLHAIGLKCKIRGTPLVLVMAAHARQHRHIGLTTTSNNRASWSVFAPRSDAALERALTPSEFAVARLVIEGKTHTEIGAARGTSQRTIANQLGSVFKKLRVSGRFALIARAIETQAAFPHIGPDPNLGLPIPRFVSLSLGAHG
jgi:DNA-binding CsgD family transcriptional regulator